MSTHPRLWVISELYYPEQTSTGYFLTRIAEGLADDYDVQVICGRPTYSEQGVEAARIEDHGGVHIRRARATHFPKDRLLLRALNSLTLTASVVWHALTKIARGDRVLIVTNPPSIPPFIALIAWMKGARAHLLVHDVYPEVLSATGFLPRESLIYGALQRFFSASARSFETVITLGRDMAEVMQDKVGSPDNKNTARVTIIPNWGDVDELGPIAPEANAFLIENAITAPTVIQFSGNIGRTHDVETILEAARRLRHREDIVFVFVGYGGKAQLVEQASGESAGADGDPGRASNLRFLPRQPRHMLGAMLSSASATIIPFIPEMRGISVPSRMYNIMATATPIIAMAESQSELSLVVAEEDAGWVLTPGDTDALVALIERIASEPGASEAADKGRKGREAAQRSYQLSAVLDQYRRVLG